MGTNWLYFHSSYAGAIPVTAVTAAKDVARFYQWVAYAAPGVTPTKSQIGRCSTIFKGTEGTASIGLLDNKFETGWTNANITNPLTGDMISGTSLLVRDTDHSAQTYNSTAIPAVAASTGVAAVAARGSWSNDCALRRPFTDPSTFSLKIGDTLKFKTGAYILSKEGATPSNLVGGMKDFDLLVLSNASAVNAAMAAAVALTMLM